MRRILDGDASTGKDVVGRVFFRPFAANTSGPDLGFGIAGSTGTEKGTLTAPALGSYSTPGQLALFRYRADGTAPNTVLAEGRRTRVSPQGYFYAGPVGVLAEYVRSTHNVRRATQVAELTSQAWQVSGGWVLTGERESYTGITPDHPLDGTQDRRTRRTRARGAIRRADDRRSGVPAVRRPDDAAAARARSRRGAQLAAHARRRVLDELRAHAARRTRRGDRAIDGARGADAAAARVLREPES